MSVNSVGGPSGPEQVSGDSSYTQMWQSIASALQKILDDPPMANNPNDTTLTMLRGELAALAPFVNDPNMPQSLKNDFNTLQTDLNNYRNGQCTWDTIFDKSSGQCDLQHIINDFSSCSATLQNPAVDFVNSMIAFGNQMICQSGDPNYDITLDINNPQYGLAAQNYYKGFGTILHSLVNPYNTSPFGNCSKDLNAAVDSLGDLEYDVSHEHICVFLNNLSQVFDDLNLGGLIPSSWKNY